MQREVRGAGAHQLCSFAGSLQAGVVIRAHRPRYMLLLLLRVRSSCRDAQSRREGHGVRRRGCLSVVLFGIEASKETTHE